MSFDIRSYELSSWHIILPSPVKGDPSQESFWSRPGKRDQHEEPFANEKVPPSQESPFLVEEACRKRNQMKVYMAWLGLALKSGKNSQIMLQNSHQSVACMQTKLEMGNGGHSFVRLEHQIRL